MLNKKGKRSSMYTALTVFFALALIIFQFLKDRSEKAEDELRQEALNKVNDELRAKSQEVIDFQRKSFHDLQLVQDQLNKKNEDLLRTQQEMIQLQQTVSEFVTGGSNFPSITLELQYGILSPRNPLYARFFITNNANTLFQY